MRMIFKVDWIKTAMGHKPKVEPDGRYAHNEKGHYVYEPCERFTVRLIPVGFPVAVGAITDPSIHENVKTWPHLHGAVGSIVLEHISAEAAAQFKVGKEYYFEPKEVT